jgi:hypothetical protein
MFENGDQTRQDLQEDRRAEVQKANFLVFHWAKESVWLNTVEASTLSQAKEDIPRSLRVDMWEHRPLSEVSLHRLENKKQELLHSDDLAL